MYYGDCSLKMSVHMFELLKQTLLWTMTEKTKACVWTANRCWTTLPVHTLRPRAATLLHWCFCLIWHNNLNKVNMWLEDVFRLSKSFKISGLITYQICYLSCKLSLKAPWQCECMNAHCFLNFFFNSCNLRYPHSWPALIKHDHMVWTTTHCDVTTAFVNTR